MMDGRKQPIRGLWIRHSRFIARIVAEDSLGTRGFQRPDCLRRGNNKPSGGPEYAGAG